MAADLRDTAVTVNLLLPGGATATGMLADDVPRGPGPSGACGDGSAHRVAGLGRGGRRARRAHQCGQLRALAARPARRGLTAAFKLDQATGMAGTGCRSGAVRCSRSL